MRVLAVSCSSNLQQTRPKLKLCLFHLTRPTHENTPVPKIFIHISFRNFFFFLRLFGPKIIVFDVLLHSTESDATSLNSDSSQPIICLVLQEPPETTILLADIFSSVAADGIHFLLSILTKMIDFGQCRKGSELADASLSF